jgi:hypothetical protein
MRYGFPGDPDDPGIEMHQVVMSADEYWGLLCSLDPEQRNVQLQHLMGTLEDLEGQVDTLHKFIGVMVATLNGRVEVPFNVQEMGTILLSYEQDDEKQVTVISIVPDPDSVPG